MYVVLLPIQCKDGAKEQILEALVPNAQMSVETEPRCHRFDIVQDAGDANRIWMYQIYADEAAFKAHKQSQHVTRTREIVSPLEEHPQDLKGAQVGSTMIWPQGIRPPGGE